MLRPSLPAPFHLAIFSSVVAGLQTGAFDSLRILKSAVRVPAGAAAFVFKGAVFFLFSAPSASLPSSAIIVFFLSTKH